MEDQRLLGPRAGEKIRDMLVKQKPGMAIRQIQERSGLNLPDIGSIYPLLDHHGLTRHEIHLRCMKALKGKLLHQLETAQMDNARVNTLLDSMLPYIDVEGLQELPLCLLGRFPDRMTDPIIDKIGKSEELFKIAPKVVQRRVWLSNPNKFQNDIIPIVKAYMNDPEIIRMSMEMSAEQPTVVINQRRSHASIKKLLDFIGGDMQLYNNVMNSLRSLFVLTNDAIYCTLRYDVLMACHEANIRAITTNDPSHELVWNLDACNRTLSMDERRVENIRKFFDKVARDDPVHGDIAMILNDPFTSNMIASRLLQIMIEATQTERFGQAENTTIWTATMLNLGAHARRIVQQQKFRIPKVEANVTDKFMSTLNSYILNDAIRSLKQDSEEPYQIDEVEFTEENLVALDDSEVARKLICHYILNRLAHMDVQALSKVLPNFVASLKRNANYDYQSEVMDSFHVTYRSFFHSFVGILLRQHQITRFLTTRKWQTVIMNDFFLPCAAIDSAAYEEVVNFLLNAFRLVASSGRAGSIGDSFSNLGRWLETLYTNRPESTISEEKNIALRGTFAQIVSDAGVFSGGRYKIRQEDIPTVLPYVQPVWAESQMDTSS
ncbi:cofactor of BRCA1-domain-containing protein [Linnemannia elongata]|nr:cofactor of BRCA1-domain-containing protein [Linnemannia elongata]